jgi:hypothetical protein
MRTPVILRNLLLFLALALPAFALAQFQPPTPDELKVTDDPKAPGAAAVYLYREDVTDDAIHYHSYYSRKKTEAERKADKLKTIKNAEDVWQQKSGSGDDLALLYVALARAAQLDVWPMKVVDRTRATFDPNYLSTSQLDDYIAIVQLNG